MGAEKRILGVLAGRDYDQNQLRAWIQSSTLILAADGGADSLISIGQAADTVIGDLDSISPQASSNATRLIHEPDQETSDCDKLLMLMGSYTGAALTLTGVEGDRLDHVFATVHSILRSGLQVQIALRRGIGLPIFGPTHCRFSHEGRMSLLPIGPCVVSMAGVKWPVDKREFTPGGATSLSNQALGEVTITVDSGSALLVIEQQNNEQWSPSWSLVGG